MTYRIAPRRFCLVIDPDRIQAWSLDRRLDFRRLGLAIRYIERTNVDFYQGYEPGELRCVGFDSTKRGQIIVEFEEAFALPQATDDDCVRFADLPAGQWKQMPAIGAAALKYLH